MNKKVFFFSIVFFLGLTLISDMIFDFRLFVYVFAGLGIGFASETIAQSETVQSDNEVKE